MSAIFKLLIIGYQKFISPLKPKSCRYYPTCSQFALWHFENNSIFKAIYFTIARIFRCNQLFKGGFDYPIVKKYKKRDILFKKINVKYWEIPVSKDKFKIIKNWKWEDNNEFKYE